MSLVLKTLPVFVIFFMSVTSWSQEDVTETAPSTPSETLSEDVVPAEQDLKDPQFIDGVKAYQNKNFDLAKKIFDSLLKKHPNNPSLLFNLGLVEYQLGQVGKALGLWRRAQFISPRFKPAQAAIEFVEEKLFPQSSSPSFLVTLLQTLTRFSFHFWMLLCLLSFLIFSWMAIDYGAKKKRAILQWPVGLYLLIPLVLIAGVLAFLTFNMSQRILATVIVNNQMTFVSPSESSPTLSELTAGQSVTVEKFHDNWAQVKTESGSEGWVPLSGLILARGDQ